MTRFGQSSLKPEISARFASPETAAAAERAKPPEPAHLEIETDPAPPAPEEVKRISPEGRPAEADSLSGHQTFFLMMIPLLLCGAVGLIVASFAGFAAGFVALVIACALAAVFNPVFWAAGNRAQEREEIVERHKHQQ